jgi:hypothetical protein
MVVMEEATIEGSVAEDDGHKETSAAKNRALVSKERECRGKPKERKLFVIPIPQVFTVEQPSIVTPAAE